MKKPSQKNIAIRIKEAAEKNPLASLAMDFYNEGIRYKDIDAKIMSKYVSDPDWIKVSNYLRDLEISGKIISK
jgi:hypothetical protein